MKKFQVELEWNLEASQMFPPRLHRPRRSEGQSQAWNFMPGPNLSNGLWNLELVCTDVILQILGIIIKYIGLLGYFHIPLVYSLNSVMVYTKNNWKKMKQN